MTRKPIPDCPLCEGAGVLPGRWNAHTACGFQIGAGATPPCPCTEPRPRGTDPLKLRKRLTRMRAAIEGVAR